MRGEYLVPVGMELGLGGMNPTCVGNIHFALHRPKMRWSQPHMRGDMVALATLASWLIELTPHARGTSGHVIITRVSDGINPTCVGNIARGAESGSHA